MLIFFRERLGKSLIWQKSVIWVSGFNPLQPDVAYLYPLSRPHHFKFFKDYLSQILLGPFLNTLTHLQLLLITHCI